MGVYCRQRALVLNLPAAFAESTKAFMKRQEKIGWLIQSVRGLVGATGIEPVTSAM
jgi:hypothetical protein